MKKVFITLVIVFVCVGGCLFVLANIDSTEEQYDSLLSEVFDKITPFSIGESVKNVTANNQEIVQQYGEITVTKGELEIAKLMLVQKNSDNNAEQAVSTDDALNSVLKKKLLVRDAAERGLVIDDAEIEQSLAGIRENLGVTDNGTVTKNDEVQKLLKESGLTYSEYEKAIEMNIPYALLYYDYAKLLYEELSQKQSDVAFGDEMVDAYLETLLTELKSNS